MPQAAGLAGSLIPGQKQWKGQALAVPAQGPVPLQVPCLGLRLASMSVAFGISTSRRCCQGVSSSQKGQSQERGQAQAHGF